MMALRNAKKDLRGHLTRVLKDVSADSITSQSSTIAKTLLALPEYHDASRISIYLSMPSAEVQTSAIVRDALSHGKQVFIPICYKLTLRNDDRRESTMDMLQLESLQDYENLRPDKWGIPTPNEETLGRRKNCFGGQGKTEGSLLASDCEEGLDLIITPGLGFDCEMGRIGRGMAFYDEFFARCQIRASARGMAKVPWKVGLSLQEQLLPTDQTVPMEETDHRLDALIVGNGRILRRAV